MREPEEEETYTEIKDKCNPKFRSQIFPGERAGSPDAAGFKGQGKSEPDIHSEMRFLLLWIEKDISKMIM